ncbi:MAG: hypothetical protein ACRCWQ_09335 [Bacilli bacterium]
MVSELKQILVITDGCSNKGVQPEHMALFAKEQGITVNVIGIIESEEQQNSIQEVQNIANAGGGVAQFTTITQLQQTVQMVTQKAMTHTIANVVHQELRSILGGNTSWTDISPEKRSEILEVVEDLTETLGLKLAILVDCSSSMKGKMQTVKEALYDLGLTMRSRQGNNSYSLHVFPGKYNDCDCLLNWTTDFTQLPQLNDKLSPVGMTPTGPALRIVTSFFTPRYRDVEEYDESCS